MLQTKHDDYVKQEEMTERLDGVLKLYLKQKDDDMSGKAVFSALALELLAYTIRGRWCG